MALVLIIERDDAIADVLRLIIEGCGFSVNGLADISMLSDVDWNAITLVIIDHFLDNFAGLCRLLKSQTHTQHIPIILLSTQNRVAEKNPDCAADVLMEKPFNLKDLIYHVERLTGSIPVGKMES